QLRQCKGKLNMVWVLLILFGTQVLQDVDRPAMLSADGNVDGRKPKVYCGIYAAYGAATAVLQKSGQKPTSDFGELLSTEYVSGLSGSSTRDILRALERLGCKGTAYQFLSLRSLEGSKHPMILHASGRGALGVYKHWLLFLGIEAGKAVIRDGEGGDYLMPISELLCRWDGRAIAVFDKSEKPPKLHSWEVASNCVFLCGIGFILFVIKSLTVDKAFRGQALAFIALLVLGVGHSFLVNPFSWIESPLVRSVAIHTQPELVRSIQFRDLQRSIENSEVTIVDCRYREDYESGCIENSINIPVDMSHSKLEAVAKRLRKDLPVILYCQSRGCKFSDVIAVELAKLGFRDLSNYRNGYVEWQAKSK
ncbi:MAG: rhodanese-like domain-containing protein, partial [Pirellula sp.]